MSLVSTIEWEACLLEPLPDAELTRRVARESGRPPNSIDYFSATPEIAAAMGKLGLEVRTRTHLHRDIGDLIGLVVSQDNSCRFCYAYQRLLMRGFGFDEERIEQIEQGFLTADLEPRQKVALEFARKVSRSNPLPSDADKQAMRDAGYSELEIVEAIGHIGNFIFHNRLATLPALPAGLAETLPDRWYMKLAQPILALFLKRLYRIGGAVLLSPNQKGGAFGPIVEAFDGLSFAPTLRDAIDLALAPGALDGRTKALLFAVVARSLGCPVSEAESARILGEMGVKAETVEEILAHLTSPELDEVEKLLMPFARDTVWYNQALPIQRKARELRDAMKLEQFLEAVYTLSVANMVCRLAVALPEPHPA
jgi:AhpD family alkylhydroperoxidase